MTIEKFEGSFSKEELGVTILTNKVIRLLSKDLSALGLYVYLMSLPSNWEPNYRHLMSELDISKDKVYGLLNKLKAVGLLTCTEVREQGKFARNHYTVHHRPVSPFPEKPEAVKPDPVNPETYITKNINKTNTTTTTGIVPVSQMASGGVASQGGGEIVISKEVDDLLVKANLGHQMHAKDRKEFLCWCKFFMEHLCVAPDQPAKIRVLMSIFKKGGLTKPKGYVDSNDIKQVYVHEMPKTEHVKDKSVGREWLDSLQRYAVPS